MGREVVGVINAIIIFALIACLSLAGGCGERPHRVPSTSVTVKLPPARPASARPGFALDDRESRK